MSEIHIEDIHSVQNFLNLMTVKKEEINHQIKLLEKNYQDLSLQWVDTQRILIDQEYDKANILMATYLRDLDYFIDFLKRFLMAINNYIDQGT